eukprot:6185790-Pleurochrysis_carterae.AAC.1
MSTASAAPEAQQPDGMREEARGDRRWRQLPRPADEQADESETVKAVEEGERAGACLWVVRGNGYVRLDGDWGSQLCQPRTFAQRHHGDYERSDHQDQCKLSGRSRPTQANSNPFQPATQPATQPAAAEPVPLQRQLLEPAALSLRGRARLRGGGKGGGDGVGDDDGAQRQVVGPYALEPERGRHVDARVERVGVDHR